MMNYKKLDTNFYDYLADGKEEYDIDGSPTVTVTYNNEIKNNFIEEGNC